MKPGKYSFIQQEQVIWGRPAADAIADVAGEPGAQRRFIVASRTLNRKTDVVATVRARLGARAVGLFDETEEQLSAYRVTTNADGSWNIARSKPSPIRQIVAPHLIR